MTPLRRQTLPFYEHPRFLRSSSRGPCGLPVYVEDLALAYANVSSYLSLISPSPCTSYDPRVWSNFELRASKSDNT